MMGRSNAINGGAHVWLGHVRPGVMVMGIYQGRHEVNADDHCVPAMHGRLEKYTRGDGVGSTHTIN